MSETITITFCERAENHVGMQIVGIDNSDNISGFTFNDLLKIKTQLTDQYICEFFNLSNFDIEAGILVIRNMIDFDKDLFEEMKSLQWDVKAKMYGKVVNKKARWNLIFSNAHQDANYEEGRGTVVSFDTTPLLSKVRDLLSDMTPIQLVAEGNYYHDINKCGISYHGDSERRIVIGVRLGASMNLCYAWYHKYKRVTNVAEIMLNSGDVYIMSDKAVGNDWKKSSIPTLRHAAGCNKFTK